MNKEEIEEYVSNNIELLPLLFNDLIFKDNLPLHHNAKEIKSDKYSDDSYSIHKFYKSISRF